LEHVCFAASAYWCYTGVTYTSYRAYRLRDCSQPWLQEPWHQDEAGGKAQDSVERVRLKPMVIVVGTIGMGVVDEIGRRADFVVNTDIA
jgi:hypothetical protein